MRIRFQIVGARVSKIQAGHTLIELLAVFSLIAVLTGFASINLHDLADTGQGSAAQLSGFIKMVRARAISTSSAYLLKPSTTEKVLTFRGSSCADTAPLNDAEMTLELPHGVSMTDINWQLCFTPRGLADSSVSVFLEDQYQEAFEVQVFMGGAVRIQ